MRKTKKEIMEDINKYAKNNAKNNATNNATNEEITPSVIIKYLLEELKLSRGSVYRFFSKADDAYISIGTKKPEKRDNENYSAQEYAKITEKVFDIIYKMNLPSNAITLNQILLIAEKVGATPQFISYNILGIDTKAFGKLLNNEIKETKISLGLGFKDLELSERVKQVKHELIYSMYGKHFSLEEIKSLSKEKDIPLVVLFKKVFCLTRTQILNLYKGKTVIFLSKREFIDYKYNGPIKSLEEISEDISPSELENNDLLPIFKEEDKKDSLYEDDEFYNIHVKTQEEYILELNKKKELLLLKSDYLTEKYDEMYLELLNSYRELNINVNKSTLYTLNSNKIIEKYIQQLKEIIIRNPKYYEFYPPKLRLADFEKIAEDFNFDKKFLAYKMFKECHYDRKKAKAKNPYFEISDKKMVVASDFYVLFQTELDKGIKRIVSKTLNEYNISKSNMDDLCQILKMKILIRGNEILFYSNQCESKEEYLSIIFAYLKVVCVNKCMDINNSMSKSLNEKIRT